MVQIRLILADIRFSDLSYSEKNKWKKAQQIAYYYSCKSKRMVIFKEKSVGIKHHIIEEIKKQRGYDCSRSNSYTVNQQKLTDKLSEDFRL